MPAYAPAIDLGLLDGLNGFRINGVDSNDYLGRGLWLADFTGDGVDDLMLGALGADPGATFHGGVSYLVNGGQSFGAAFDLTTLDGTNGFRIDGDQFESYFGLGVTGGDLNGDGYDEFVIGAYGENNLAGSVFVVFGTAAGMPATMTPADLAGGAGFRINGGTAFEDTGLAVCAAGDINGDGYDDLAISNSAESRNGRQLSGSVYIVYGKETGLGNINNLQALSASDGLRIDGAAQTNFLGSGYGSVKFSDINNDGKSDIIIGAHSADPGGAFDAGSAYVVYGAASFGGPIDLATLDPGAGFRLDGDAANMSAGYTVGDAGDVNGDHFRDFVISDASGAFVIFGKGTAYSPVIDLGSLGADGFQITSPQSSAAVGRSVSSAGDFNADGFDDLLVGCAAENVSPAYDQGSAYVIFGKAAGWGSILSLADIDGSNGIRLTGVGGGDQTGETVCTGDVNGDGISDVMVAASLSDANGYQSGTVYIVYGALPGQAVTRIGSDIGQAIHGGDFDDFVSGLGGADTLLGHGADDTLVGGEGDDELDGDTGSDTASYENAAAAVTVTVLSGQQNTLGAGLDTFISIENLRGSDFADRLTGDSGANVIEGGGGDDTMQGGGDRDTASYAHAAGAVTVSLEVIAVGQNTGGAGTDRLSNFENLRGSSFGDLLTGDQFANRLEGGDGADTLVGGLGADTLRGGLGVDTASYAASNGAYVRLWVTGAQNTFSGTDTLDSIENLIGSAFDDILEGDNKDNSMVGGGGTDQLTGGVGNDTLVGGAGLTYMYDSGGNDRFEGTLGAEHVYYYDAFAAVTVDLNLSTAQMTGGGGIDTLIDIGGLVGSSYNDHFTGHATTASYLGGGGGADTLLGGAAADQLFGHGAADSLVGGAGNDTLYGGPNNDVLDGGADFDTVNYFEASTGVTVSLLLLGAQNTVGGGTDRLASIEALVGSIFADRFAGDGSANNLYGEGGDDTLEGGLGDDLLDGGAQRDTASYAGAVAAVTVNLALQNTAQNTGAAGVDTLKDIENLQGSGFDDTLKGDQFDNKLSGGFGADTLVGGAGADIFLGGAGIDTVTYAAGGPVTVKMMFPNFGAGDGLGDTFTDVERLIGSDFADWLQGDFGATYIEGGLGADTLWSGDGSDTLVGGQGADQIRMTANPANIADSVFADGGSEDDFIEYVGHPNNTSMTVTVHGGGGFDHVRFHNPGHLTGGNFVIFGEDGSDLIEAHTGGGAYTIDGGKGDDTISALIDGTYSMRGGAGNDMLIGADVGQNTLYGDADDDIIIGGYGGLFNGFDRLYGGSGADLIRRVGSGPHMEYTVDAGPGDDVVQFQNDGYVNNNNTTVTLGQGADVLEAEVGAIGARIIDITDFETAAGRDRIDFTTWLNSTLLTGWTAGMDPFAAGYFQLVQDGTTTFFQVDRDGAAAGAGFATVLRFAGVGHLDFGTLNFVTGHNPQAVIPGRNLQGTPQDDIIHGTNFNDTIAAFASNDAIYGYDGDDYISGGAGNDTISGGLGRDTANYGGSAAGVTVSLLIASPQNSGDGIDTLISMENLVGTKFNDVLTGNNAANTLSGGRSNDSLAGLDGTDWLDGGDGADTLQGGKDSDTLSGGKHSDSLDGGDGADTLDGGEGSDTLNGGSGTDTAGYAFATSGVTVNLLSGLTSGGGGSDSLSLIENVIGSNFSDKLIGTNTANSLTGGLGKDTLQGLGGNDTLDGGGADDSLVGSLGLDSLLGGVGLDTLVGGLGKDFLTGSADADTFRYLALTDSSVSLSDRITDLSAIDKIDLKAIDANSLINNDQAFAIVGAVTSGAGQLVRSYDAGSNVTTFRLYVNGDAIADAMIEVDGDWSGFSNFVL